MKCFHQILLCAIFFEIGAARYEWACSEANDLGGRSSRYLPSERNANAETALTAVNELYIFPVRNLNEACSGKVTAIEYCYHYDVIRAGEAVQFNWTVLILEDDGAGNFRITNSYTIESRTDSGAASSGRRTCCDIEQINSFNLSVNFIFGVTGPCQGNTHNATLLGFADSLPQYQVDTVIQSRAGLSLSVGSRIRSAQVVPRGLRMLWFVIDDGLPLTTPEGGTTTPDNNNYQQPNSTFVAWEILGGMLVIIVLAMSLATAVVLFVLKRSKRSEKVESKNSCEERFLHDVVGDRVGTAGVQSDVTDGRVEVMLETVNPYLVTGPTVMREPPEQKCSQSSINNQINQPNQGGQGQTTVVDDEEELYCCPVSDVSELYKQLSSKKYREIKRHQIQIREQLGFGQFSTVSKGVWQSPMGAMDVAVKQLQSGASEEEKVKFLQEAAINGQFRHPNVVQLLGVVTVGEPTTIVLELLSNGNLTNYLAQLKPLYKGDHPNLPHLLLKFCQQVAAGMEYLSRKTFVHRDLAARNILVGEDKTCKISDFRMSRDLMDENYYISHGGKIPVKWTAPEALHYKKYSTASDMWSFGCVMYEIWSLGHKPFEIQSNAEAIRMVDEGYRLPPPPGLPKELYKIMIQCWNRECSLRPTFPQLVEMLSRTDFVWEEEDLIGSDPQVKVIGAPLEVAKNLYPELQRSYLKKSKGITDGESNRPTISSWPYSPTKLTEYEQSAHSHASRDYLESIASPSDSTAYPSPDLGYQSYETENELLTVTYDIPEKPETGYSFLTRPSKPLPQSRSITLPFTAKSHVDNHLTSHHKSMESIPLTLKGVCYTSDTYEPVQSYEVIQQFNVLPLISHQNPIESQPPSSPRSDSPACYDQSSSNSISNGGDIHYEQIQSYEKVQRYQKVVDLTQEKTGYFLTRPSKPLPQSRSITLPFRAKSHDNNHLTSHHKSMESIPLTLKGVCYTSNSSNSISNVSDIHYEQIQSYEKVQRYQKVVDSTQEDLQSLGILPSSLHVHSHTQGSHVSLEQPSYEQIQTYETIQHTNLEEKECSTVLPCDGSPSSCALESSQTAHHKSEQ